MGRSENILGAIAKDRRSPHAQILSCLGKMHTECHKRIGGNLNDIRYLMGSEVCSTWYAPAYCVP